MIIGVPREIKPEEYRIGVLPPGVRQLTQAGHEVFVQSRAGIGAGFSDASYESAGARILDDGARIFERAQIIVKVKEPAEEEFALFHENQTLFCYLRAENKPALVDFLLKAKITAIAFENVKCADGFFPLLAPMSIIAGQQAVFQAMQFHWSHKGGSGTSMLPYPGQEPPRMVILGAGQAGVQAAVVAAALGMEVSLFEISATRIRQLGTMFAPNIRLLQLQTVPLEPYLRQADIVINAATVPSHSSRHLISRDMIGKMKKGTVIVDITANLQGAIETIDRHTTLGNPSWEVDGVIHYCVTNIPGTVARTASQALAQAVQPFLIGIADRGPVSALRTNQALCAGLTAILGHLTSREAGTSQGRPWCTPHEALKKLSKAVAR